MIKGVNRKIIEINNPDSLYFEKAVFYLRPNVHELPEEITAEEASRYAARLGLDLGRRRRRRNTGRYIILTLLGAAAVSLIAALLI